MIDVKWLETCATAGEFLYGQYTISALKKMYEGKPGYRITAEELVSAMRGLEKSGSIMMTYVEGQLDEKDEGPGFFLPAECEYTPLEAVMRKADEEGNPYASLHFDEDERLDLITDCPEDIDFYIPTAEETEQLMAEGYIRATAMTELEEQITLLGGDPEFLKGMWSKVSTGKLDMMDAIKMITSESFSGQDENKPAPTIDELNKLVRYVNDFLNNVNLRSRRGWRPDDLFRKMNPKGLTQMPTIIPGSANMARMMKESEPKLRSMGFNVDYSSIDSYETVGEYGEKVVVRVGRNDPCPCGSGKKYKKCHGR